MPHDKNVVTIACEPIAFSATELVPSGTIRLRSADVGEHLWLEMFSAQGMRIVPYPISYRDARVLALMLIRLTQAAFPNAAPDDLDALRAEYLNFRQDMLDAMNQRDETGLRSLEILLRHFQLEKNFDGEGHDRLVDPRASLTAAKS
jgi:hypothetical protein